MAKAAREKEHKPAGKKKAKKHLRSIRSEQAEDGSIVHHHTYAKSREDHITEPERMNVATSQTPDEAGQHVAEQFGMNGAANGSPEPDQDDEQQQPPAPAGGQAPEAE